MLTRARRRWVVVTLVLVMATAAAIAVDRRRTRPYERERDAVLTTYTRGYQACIEHRGVPSSCARSTYDACGGDRFWQKDPPFSFGLADPMSDASTLCQGPAHAGAP